MFARKDSESMIVRTVCEALTFCENMPLEQKKVGIDLRLACSPSAEQLGACQLFWIWSINANPDESDFCGFFRLAIIFIRSTCNPSSC